MQVADALRAGGFEGPLTLVGDEPVLPYQRPPLSKEHLASAGAPLPFRAGRFFADHGIDLRTGVGLDSRVQRIDPGPGVRWIDV